jgi:hypothetical protein
MSCCTPQTISGFPTQTVLLTEEATHVFGEVYQGDDFNITLMVVNVNSVVVDLTGDTFRLSIDWNCLECRRPYPLYAAELSGDPTGIINFIVPGFGASAYLDPWWGYQTPYPTFPCGPLRLSVKRWKTISTILARDTVIVGDLLVLPSITTHATPMPIVAPQ